MLLAHCSPLSTPATPTPWWRLAWTGSPEARGPDWTSQIAASSTAGCWRRRAGNRVTATITVS